MNPVLPYEKTVQIQGELCRDFLPCTRRLRAIPGIPRITYCAGTQNQPSSLTVVGAFHTATLYVRGENPPGKAISPADVYKMQGDLANKAIKSICHIEDADESRFKKLLTEKILPKMQESFFLTLCFTKKPPESDYPLGFIRVRAKGKEPFIKEFLQNPPLPDGASKAEGTQWIRTLREITLDGVEMPENFLKCMAEHEVFEKICIKNTDITSVPPSFFQQKHLEYLNLGCNGLNTLPKGTYDLPSVRTIDFSGNKLTGAAFEGVSWSVDALEHLNLSENHIEKLFIPISHNKGRSPVLKTLNVAGNRLSGLPSAFNGVLDGLEELNISWNRFGKIVPGIVNFESVKIFLADGNELNELPGEFMHWGIEECSLSHNKFTKIPDCLLQAPRLERLNLSHNGMTVRGPEPKLKGNDKCWGLRISEGNTVLPPRFFLAQLLIDLYSYTLAPIFQAIGSLFTYCCEMVY